MKLRTFGFSLLVVALVSLIGGAAYSQISEDSKGPPPSLAPEGVPTMEPIVRDVLGPRGDGLFADGENASRATMDTKEWKTYTNTKYGYSFKYPPSWEVIREADNGDCRGPQDRLCMPVQIMYVGNPKGEREIPSKECDIACEANAPRILEFSVQIASAPCPFPGKALVEGEAASRTGQVASDASCIHLRHTDPTGSEDAAKFATYAFPYENEALKSQQVLWLLATFVKGADIDGNEQAVLDTIFSTLEVK